MSWSSLRDTYEGWRTKMYPGVEDTDRLRGTFIEWSRERGTPVTLDQMTDAFREHYLLEDFQFFQWVNEALHVDTTAQPVWCGICLDEGASFKCSTCSTPTCKMDTARCALCSSAICPAHIIKVDASDGVPFIVCVVCKARKIDAKA